MQWAGLCVFVQLAPVADAVKSPRSGRDSISQNFLSSGPRSAVDWRGRHGLTGLNSDTGISRPGGLAAEYLTAAEILSHGRPTTSVN